jgi:hypothetical protein
MKKILALLVLSMLPMALSAGPAHGPKPGKGHHHQGRARQGGQRMQQMPQVHGAQAVTEAPQVGGIAGMMSGMPTVGQMKMAPGQKAAKSKVVNLCKQIVAEVQKAGPAFAAELKKVIRKELKLGKGA